MATAVDELLGWLEEVVSRLPLAWLSVCAATGMWWVGPWEGRCRRRGGPPFFLGLGVAEWPRAGRR